MARAAIAFISGPGVKLMRALRPNFLLKAASNSANPFLPPNVSEPATITSPPSFLAPAMNWSKLSAAFDRWVTPRANNENRIVTTFEVFTLRVLRLLTFSFHSIVPRALHDRDQETLKPAYRSWKTKWLPRMLHDLSDDADTKAERQKNLPLPNRSVSHQRNSTHVHEKRGK